MTEPQPTDTEEFDEDALTRDPTGAVDDRPEPDQSQYEDLNGNGIPDCFEAIEDDPDYIDPDDPDANYDEDEEVE